MRYARDVYASFSGGLSHETDVFVLDVEDVYDGAGAGDSEDVFQREGGLAGGAAGG